MPSVDVAMARSLRGGIWGTLKDSVVRSIAADLSRRDIIGDAKDKVTDVQTAFSSWDNCMEVAYCKWPVIAIIIVGGLILFSILWCIIRCCCCGMSCCCGCFSFLKCCGNCCGCCDSPKDKQHKHLDQPYIAPHHGYQQQQPMHASPFPVTSTPFAPAAASGPPQYAQFDAPKKGAEDSLPQMPSWEASGSKKVMLEEEEVEMDQLNKTPAAGQNKPAGVPPSPGLSTPRPMNTPSPYGRPQGPPARFMGAQSQQPPSQYSPLDGPSSNVPSRESGGYGLDQPYDLPPAVGGLGPGPQSPALSYNGQQAFASGHNGQQSRAMAYNGPQSPAMAYNGQLSPATGYNGQRSPALSHNGQQAVASGYNAPQSPAFNFNGQPQPQAQPEAYEMPAPIGALALGRQSSAMGRQSPALNHNAPSPAQSYGFPAPVSPNDVGRHSPAPGHNGYSQPGDSHPGFAEMPSEPNELEGSSSYAQAPQSPVGNQASESPHGYGMRRQGTGDRPDGHGMRRQGTGDNSPGGFGMRRQGTGDNTPDGYGMRRRGTGDNAHDGYGIRRQGTGDHTPEGYGMRRAGTGDSAGPSGGRTPRGMDPRMRNSPGPRRTPGPRGDQPFPQPPRGSPAPRNDQGYGHPGPNSPRDAVNRTYSPAPEQRNSPAPERRRPTEVPPAMRRPGPERPFAQEPPSSPITNNSGFDFTSGYARPQNQDGLGELQEPPAQQAYPGYKPYQQI